MEQSGNIITDLVVLEAEAKFHAKKNCENGDMTILIPALVGVGGVGAGMLVYAPTAALCVGLGPFSLAGCGAFALTATVGSAAVGVYGGGVAGLHLV